MRSPAADPGDVEFAVAAARRAGELTLQWFQRRDLRVDHKHDGSPVTQADRAAESLLRELIGQRFGSDAVIGEEHRDKPGRNDRTWVIDPIDGTEAFTRGVALFANLVALIDEHGPAIGVINLPALGECVWAGRGLGAFWDGEPCRVSARSGLAGALVCTSGFSYWPPEPLQHVMSSGARLRTWGDAYGYALVATGRAEAMIDPECFDWDIAPMAVVINEAGGRFSDRGGADDWRNGSGMASNGLIHDELLALFG